MLGRPVVTAAEMAAMGPEELERLHIQRTVTELGALPGDLLARLLPSEDELTIRSARLRGLVESVRGASPALRDDPRRRPYQRRHSDLRQQLDPSGTTGLPHVPTRDRSDAYEMPSILQAFATG